MGRLGGAVLPAFSRRLPPGPAAAGARERAGAGDLSGPLLDPMAGLAGSQVHAAVTGEDAAGQETDAIRMNAQRVLPSTLTGSGGRRRRPTARRCPPSPSPGPASAASAAAARAFACK